MTRTEQYAHLIQTISDLYGTRMERELTDCERALLAVLRARALELFTEIVISQRWQHAA